MPETSWPTESQVQASFTSQGLTAPSGLETHIKAAVNEWESLTGWRPYFQVDENFDATSDSATWYYDSPEYSGLVLDLNRPFQSISAVKTGVTSTYAGDEQTENTDFRFLPMNYAALNLPITQIEFFSAPPGTIRSISVAGVAGIAEIPDDVWLAVRDMAMRSAILEIIQGISTASELTQGPIKLKFDNEEGRSKMDRWESQFQSVARRHMRITL